MPWPSSKVLNVEIFQDISCAQFMQLIDKQIADFFVTLSMGLEWCLSAGKKLVEIIDRNPSAIDDIVEYKDKPAWITKSVLKTVESIGRGAIAPEALLLPEYVIRRLAPLPMAEQLRLISGVDVAVPPPHNTKRKEGWHKINKPASKLTVNEAKRVIGPNGIRPANEQEGLFCRGKPKTIGLWQIVMENGNPPVITSVTGHISNYEKQRVKLKKGCALIELYL